MNTPMNWVQRLSWIVVTAVSCIGLDQITKAIAKSYLTLNDVHSLLGDTVRFQLAHNRGAFLGLGDSLPDTIRWISFNPDKPPAEPLGRGLPSSGPDVDPPGACSISASLSRF